MTQITNMLATERVIPVLAFTSAEEAVDTCHALYEGGLKALEITLRHPTALAAIAAVAKAMPADAIVGAGTVITPDHAQAAYDAGAVFGVSPGLTADLATAVTDMGWPFLPGIASVSEAMRAQEMGFQTLKFFPAEQSGGQGFLKSVGAVLPGLRFCPTGGVTAESAPAYLGLDNVFAVGGSWLTKRSADGQLDLANIKAKAAEAAKI